MHVAPGPPDITPAWPLPRRLSARDLAAEAAQNFIVGRYRDDWPMLEMFSALLMERWYRDHPPPSRRGRRTRRAMTAVLIPPALLALLASLIRRALRAVSPEPVQPGYPGRANATVRVPSAPLVRAHAILTAAPPSSPRPVLAGAPA